MKATSLFTLAFAGAVAADTNPGSCGNDACGRAVALSKCRARRLPVAHQNDCSSFLQYTSIPAAATLTETFGEQSTVQLINTVTLEQETDQATATQPDLTATTSVVPETETFTVSITPTKTVTITITQKPVLQTEVDTVTVVETDVVSTTATVYYSNVAKRDAPIEPSGTLIKPTSIPSYATACAGAEEYSSACACLGVKETTIYETGTTVIETVGLSPETVTQIDTATRPAITITTTLPALTRTVTVTLPAPELTLTTTVDDVTVSTSVTADQDTTIVTELATKVDKTTTTVTATRSVGPICSTYNPSGTTCGCKFEVVCNRQVTLDLATFRNHLDFNTYVGSFQECMSRCDNNPSCQFGQFAALPNGGLCSSYTGNPGSTNTVYSSSTTYFEKDGNVVCPGCS